MADARVAEVPDGEDAGDRGGGSADPCPACGRHGLALERPPDPVVVSDPFRNDLRAMGRLPMPVGIRCRSCGARWATIADLRAGLPGHPVGDDAASDGAPEPVDPGPAVEHGRTSAPLALRLLALAALAVVLVPAVAAPLLSPGFLGYLLAVVAGSVLVVLGARAARRLLGRG